MPPAVQRAEHPGSAAHQIETLTIFGVHCALAAAVVMTIAIAISCLGVKTTPVLVGPRF